jgi:hypothetical protein
VTVSCAKARVRKKRVKVKCTLKLPASASAARIRVTAKAGRHTLARRTLRARGQRIRFTLSRRPTVIQLDLGKATVRRRV